MSHKAKRYIVEKIAREKLGIETLATRGRDRLDFYEVGVGRLEDALLAAYEAGVKTAHEGHLPPNLDY